MNRERKFMRFQMKKKSTLRKRPKDQQTITTREWKLKIYQMTD